MPSQSEIISTLVPSLSALPDVLGVGLGGSLGRGTATEWSDVDIFLYVEHDRLLSVTESLHQIIPKSLFSLAHIDRGFVVGMGYLHQFPFADASMLDIAIITEEAGVDFCIQPTMQILFERNESLSRLLIGAYPYHARPSNVIAHYGYHYRWLFVIALITTWKSLSRADIWLSIYNIDRLRNYLFSAIRLQTGNLSPFLQRAEENAASELPENILLELNNYLIGPTITELIKTTLLLVRIYMAVITDEECHGICEIVEKRIISLDK